MGESVRLKRGTKSSCLTCGRPLTWTHQEINPLWDDLQKERNTRERYDKWYHDDTHQVYCAYDEQGAPDYSKGAAQSKSYCNSDLKGRYDTLCCKSISDALQIEGSPACGMHVKDWRAHEAMKKMQRQRELDDQEQAELNLWKISTLEAKLQRLTELGLTYEYPDAWRINDQKRHSSYSVGRMSNSVDVDIDFLLNWALDIKPQTEEIEEEEDDDVFDG